MNMELNFQIPKIDIKELIDFLKKKFEEKGFGQKPVSKSIFETCIQSKFLLFTMIFAIGGILVIFYLSEIIEWIKDLKLGSDNYVLADPNKKVQLRLIKKEHLSHDTRRFVFAFPKPDMVLGLPVGMHIYISARINGQLVVRAYTPVTSDLDKGHMDLVVKIYMRDVHPAFPLGGKMTQYLDSLPLDSLVDIRGPSGLLQYKGHGKFLIKPDKHSAPAKIYAKNLGMIAGGTGIAPMMQLLSAVFRDPGDTTEVWLIFANHTAHDILLRKELEDLERKHSDRFHLWYTVSQCEPGWAYSKGFVDFEMIKAHFPAAGPATLCLMCGPPAMITNACTPNLNLLGHRPDLCYVY